MKGEPRNEQADCHTVVDFAGMVDYHTGLTARRIDLNLYYKNYPYYNPR